MKLQAKISMPFVRKFVVLDNSLHKQGISKLMQKLLKDHVFIEKLAANNNTKNINTLQLAANNTTKNINTLQHSFSLQEF